MLADPHRNLHRRRRVREHRRPDLHRGRAGSEELHWGPGDFFVVPAWTWQQHRAEGAGGATLFSMSDEPILDKFGVLRVETAPIA